MGTATFKFNVTSEVEGDDFTDSFELDLPDWYGMDDVMWSAQTELDRVYGVDAALKVEYVGFF